MNDAAPLRADAERNRRQIIQAATEVFGARGADVPMEDVAKAAGVGVGTLYRRFPDRRALVVAVVRGTLESLGEATATALADQPTAWDALVACMAQSYRLRLIVHPERPLPPDLAEAIHVDPGLERLRRDFVEGFDRVVAAAQAEGSLRADVGTGDVVQLFAMVKRTPKEGRDALRASERSLAIILDGLSTRPAQTLPGSPVGLADLAARRRRRGPHARPDSDPAAEPAEPAERPEA